MGQFIASELETQTRQVRATELFDQIVTRAFRRRSAAGA